MLIGLKHAVLRIPVVDGGQAATPRLRALMRKWCET
jgi:hypothetical protein